MRVLYALICEQARERPDGRVDVQGIYHQLLALGFPAEQDRLVLLVNIEWDEGEEGRQEFRIDMLDRSGSPGLTIAGHSDVSRSDPEGPPPQTRILMPLEQVRFQEPGAYMFRLTAAGRELPIAPLYVHLTEEE